MSQLSLLVVFDQLNRKHFEGFLDPPVLRWNSRLRSSAGRFFPGARSTLLRASRSPTIEIASYLLEENDAPKHVADTLGHEMIHYWLWVRRRPYGHTSEFWDKLTEMGVPRYNPVPRLRPHKYVYACPVCAKEFFARRRLGVLACAGCCNQHTGGRFDPRFKLKLMFTRE